MPTAAERLHLLYEVSRRLATFTDLPELLRYATVQTRECFSADGCAILLHDRARRELYFLPVSSQEPGLKDVERQLPMIRFPAERGVAGWVLAHGESALVPDTAADPRFYSGIDQVTSMTTRALLCVPLRYGSETIGVVQVVNPAPGALTQEDLEFLQALADDIAVAHEKVVLYERLRGEVIGLRQFSRWAGYGLFAIGGLVAFGAVLTALAWATPLGDLLARPALWLGVLMVVVGGALAWVGRGGGTVRAA